MLIVRKPNLDFSRVNLKWTGSPKSTRRRIVASIVSCCTPWYFITVDVASSTQSAVATLVLVLPVRRAAAASARRRRALRVSDRRASLACRWFVSALRCLCASLARRIASLFSAKSRRTTLARRMRWILSAARSASLSGAERSLNALSSELTSLASHGASPSARAAFGAAAPMRFAASTRVASSVKASATLRSTPRLDTLSAMSEMSWCASLGVSPLTPSIVIPFFERKPLTSDRLYASTRMSPIASRTVGSAAASSSLSSASGGAPSPRARRWGGGAARRPRDEHTAPIVG